MEGVPGARSGTTLLVLTRTERRAEIEQLVKRYHADLLRVAYVVLGDRALAEDATQAAWIVAWRKVDQLRDPRKVRSWLVAVAANEARQIARRTRNAPDFALQSRYGVEADPSHLDLASALAALSADDRRLLALRYVSGLNSAEIGAELGLSAGAVRHRLMRLVGRLREAMRDD